MFIRVCKLTELGFIVSDTVSIKGMANVAGQRIAHSVKCKSGALCSQT